MKKSITKNNIKTLLDKENKLQKKKQFIFYCGKDLYNKLPNWMKS